MKFTPQLGGTYYMINSRWQVKMTTVFDSKKSRGRLNAGNCFKTKEEAEIFAQMIKDLRSGKLKTGKQKPWWAFWRFTNGRS